MATGGGRAGAAAGAVPEVSEIVATSTSAAEKFVNAFYSALDTSTSTERAALVLPFYSPTARIAWNGNPIPYADLPAFIQQLPKSDHVRQAYDCQPIVGSAANSPPALLVTVTGQVTHGGYAHPAPGVPPPTASSKKFENLPRVYSQTFILTYNPSPPPPPYAAGAYDSAYLVSADSYRFV